MAQVNLIREKDFKDTEIGRIPKDWEVVRFKNICQKIRAGGTPLTIRKEYYNGDIPFVKIEDVTKAKKYLYSTITTITKEGLDNSSAWLVPEHSLLLAIYGSLGSVAINKIQVATNQAILGIIPRHEKTDIEFLYYLFSHLNLKRYAKQTTQANLTAEIIKELEIPLPLLEEQQKIAEILSTIDKSIEKTDEIIAKTERLKKGLMHELLSGRVRVKVEDGKVRYYKESNFIDTEIGRIPKDWEVVKLGKIAKDMYYGITAKAVDKETKYRMLRTTDIKDYKTNWHSLPFCEITEKRNDITKYLLQKNDLIITRAGTAGVSVLVDKELDNIIFGSYLIKVKLKEGVDTKFIHYFLQSTFYWMHITLQQAGSTLKNISLPILKSLKIPLPPLSEQQKIAEILLTIDNKLELEKNKRSRLELVKKGLMNLLLTGKIRVRV